MSLENQKQMMLAKKPIQKTTDYSKYIWYGVPVFLLVSLIIILIYNYYDDFTVEKLKSGINPEFAIFLMVGIFAQLVDGTLGMGYGVTCYSFLLSFGIPPAATSAGVHFAKIFTTGASTISNLKFHNVNKKLALYLMVPGIIGSIAGAYLLSDVINGATIKPFIAIYMLVLSFMIITKGLKKKIQKKRTKQLGILAIFGGFLDAIGGGGWGPIVTSTLIGRGRNPRYTIGSVNTAEFAVSCASGATFLLFGVIQGLEVVVGLMIGGMIAAPIGAFLINKIPRKSATILVGILLFLISLQTLYKLW